MSELRKMFFNEQVSENFEDAIEILEEKLEEYANKPNPNKQWIINQKNNIEALKRYFIESQQYIAQLERSAPIQNYINYNSNYVSDGDYSRFTNEIRDLKKHIEMLQTVLHYHNITHKDIDFLKPYNFQKETIREASINKLKADMPHLF